MKHQRMAGISVVLLGLLVWSTAAFAQESDVDDGTILQAAAIRKSCREAYPALWDKIDSNMLTEANGFSPKVRDGILAMENSQDPLIRERVAGAAATFKELALLETSCHSFAGVSDTARNPITPK